MIFGGPATLWKKATGGVRTPRKDELLSRICAQLDFRSAGDVDGNIVYWCNVNQQCLQNEFDILLGRISNETRLAGESREVLTVRGVVLT